MRPLHQRPSFEVAPDHQHPGHMIGKAITIDGHVFACTYAESYDGPLSVERVQIDWREERSAFRPFDETTGRYLA